VDEGQRKRKERWSDAGAATHTTQVAEPPARLASSAISPDLDRPRTVLSYVRKGEVVVMDGLNRHPASQLCHVLKLHEDWPKGYKIQCKNNTQMDASGQRRARKVFLSTAIWHSTRPPFRGSAFVRHWWLYIRRWP
jgi:hypothetical protein